MFLPLSVWVIKLTDNYICCAKIFCFNKHNLIFTFITSVHLCLDT